MTTTPSTCGSIYPLTLPGSLGADALSEIFTLYDEFSYTGYWWLPNDQDNRWWGSVSYKPESGIVLELFAETGDFGSLLASSEFVELLLGEVQEYPHRITLLGNSLIRGRYITTTKISTHRLRVDYLLLGQRFCLPNDITFKSMTVSHSSLRGWMRSEIPYSKERKGIETSVAFESLNEREVIHIPTIKSQVVLIEEINEVEDASGSLLMVENYIRVVPDLPESLDWFREQTDSLRVLIAFLAGVSVENKWVSGRIAEPNPEYSMVRIYHSVQPPETDEISNSYMFFPLKHLDKWASGVFQAWFARSERFQVPVKLCLDVNSNTQQAPEQRLLKLVQALESCRKIASIKDKGSNIRNLKALRDSLSEPLRTYLELDDDLLNSIANTRNYHMHSGNLPEDLLEGPELHIAIARLVPFAAAVLCKELGIPEYAMQKAFERTEVYGLWRRPLLREQ